MTFLVICGIERAVVFIDEIDGTGDVQMSCDPTGRQEKGSEILFIHVPDEEINIQITMEGRTYHGHLLRIVSKL